MPVALYFTRRAGYASTDERWQDGDDGEREVADLGTLYRRRLGLAHPGRPTLSIGFKFNFNSNLFLLGKTLGKTCNRDGRAVH